jgi:hypothetical protein
MEIAPAYVCNCGSEYGVGGRSEGAGSEGDSETSASVSVEVDDTGCSGATFRAGGDAFLTALAFPLSLLGGGGLPKISASKPV